MTRVGIGGERGPGGAESGGQGAQVAVALAGAEQARRPAGRPAHGPRGGDGAARSGIPEGLPGRGTVFDVAE